MPTPPQHIVDAIHIYDRHLSFEWDSDKEAFWLVSERGRERAIYGLFPPEDLNTQLVASVAEGIRHRDQGVSIYDRLMAKEAHRDSVRASRDRDFSEFSRAQATREVNATSKSAKTYALGSTKSSTPGYYGNRRQAAFEED